MCRRHPRSQPETPRDLNTGPGPGYSCDGPCQSNSKMGTSFPTDIDEGKVNGPPLRTKRNLPSLSPAGNYLKTYNTRKVTLK